MKRGINKEECNNGGNEGKTGCMVWMSETKEGGKKETE